MNPLPPSSAPAPITTTAGTPLATPPGVPVPVMPQPSFVVPMPQVPPLQPSAPPALPAAPLQQPIQAVPQLYLGHAPPGHAHFINQRPTQQYFQIPAITQGPSPDFHGFRPASVAPPELQPNPILQTRPASAALPGYAQQVPVSQIQALHSYYQQLAQQTTPTQAAATPTGEVPRRPQSQPMEVQFVQSMPTSHQHSAAYREAVEDAVVAGIEVKVENITPDQSRDFKARMTNEERAYLGMSDTPTQDNATPTPKKTSTSSSALNVLAPPLSGGNHGSLPPCFGRRRPFGGQG